MASHESEALILERGEQRALPHTLSETRHLTVSVVATDVEAGTATLELRDPEAEPDVTVAGLVEEAVEDTESANERRGKLHLPEKAVPVDTSTLPTQTLECHLHEKLSIGDRVWTLSEIDTDGVTLTPGRDHETDTLVNRVEDEEYEPATLNVAEKLNAVDEGL